MMTKRTKARTEPRSDKVLSAVDGQHREEAVERTLETYDATSLVGLRVLVHHAAIERTDEQNEVTVELPKMRELLASTAVTRCLIPIRLRGWELKAMRHIMKLTLADLANKLDDRTAIETISRWESEAQPMGGYVEKLIRLLICEELREEAAGVEYNAKMISDLRVLDPWRTDPDYEVPYIELTLVRMKEQSGTIIEAWDPKIAA